MPQTCNNLGNKRLALNRGFCPYLLNKILESLFLLFKKNCILVIVCQFDSYTSYEYSYLS